MNLHFKTTDIESILNDIIERVESTQVEGSDILVNHYLSLLGTLEKYDGLSSISTVTLTVQDFGELNNILSMSKAALKKMVSDVANQHNAYQEQMKQAQAMQERMSDNDEESAPAEE